ncbi:hypothetical protein [Microbispora sp. NBC_01389]|uniref:hypothetical protein n=1 Tax=Microbispora sp. NBC_01389 TaxID=2903584 RepID=UPI003244A465
MDRLVAAPLPPPLPPTDAAVRALEGLRHDLGVRHGIPGGRITANRGTAVLVLGDLTVWRYHGERFRSCWATSRPEPTAPVDGQ